MGRPQAAQFFDGGPATRKDTTQSPGWTPGHGHWRGRTIGCAAVTSLFRSVPSWLLLGLLLTASTTRAAEAPQQPTPEQPAPEQPAPEQPVSPLTSLYPIWENTAHLLG